MIVRVLAFLMLAFPMPALSQDVARIVYLGIEGDPQYEPQVAYTGLSLKDRKRPVDGARVAMRGTRVLGRALGLAFDLEERLLSDGTELPAEVSAALASGALAVLLDVPEDEMDSLVNAERSHNGLLFNIRHHGRRWREVDCARDLFHTVPSYDMLADALAQHLRNRDWSKVLVLRSGSAADDEPALAARRALQKFGLNLVNERYFELSNDPRQRDLNNVALLTSGGYYDVIWLIDTEGEFGRYVPFATYLPRPVVGSEGLSPLAWHWTYERHGAPQLNQRFRRASDRDMSPEDWAAWVAVRAVVEGVSRVQSIDPGKVAQYVRSDGLSLDLYKGVPGSFRPWNGQLRQPILLATHNAVIERAPIDGFEHQFDTLDTLGIDRPQSQCGSAK